MSTDYPTLWQTKLYRPRVTRTLVQRPQLIQRLNNGMDQQLILVCAPAGFGKTTLVSSWIESMGESYEGGSTSLPTAWLSLEETESDVMVFVQYLIAVLCTIFDDACSDTLALFQARQIPPLKVIATLLSNEIDRLPGDFFLILDDYHTIKGEAVSNLINELLLHWPRPLHLVLISRSNPPLLLARLRANDQLTEIRSRDLRFSKEETADFISLVLQTQPSGALLEKLEKKTEGWIGALRLAAQSLRTRSDPEGMLMLVESSGETLVEYLVDEVLVKQYPAVQTFLLKTSILDRFCPPLCEAVIGDFDPEWRTRACIDWLEGEELFVTPMDNRKKWYRYHHLFRDILRFRLSAEMAPEEVRELHHRASAWFDQQGLVDEALKHALLANDLDHAVGLMERGLRGVLNRLDRLTMERWLRLLPEEMIQSRPWLLMIRVWTLHFTWQLNELSKCLTQLEVLINEGGAETLGEDDLLLLRGQIALARGQEAFFSNQMKRVAMCCQEALRLMPQSWKFVRGGALFYLGMSMQAVGEDMAAERMLLDSYEILGNKTDTNALLLLQALCFNYHSEGQLEKLRQTAVVLLQQATHSGQVYTQGWAHFFMGSVYYQWNELDPAGQHFAAVVENRYLIHQAVLQNCMFGLALVNQARGKGLKAIQIQELASQADIERIGYEEVSTLSMHARVMLLQGNLDSAFRWANAYTAPVPDHPLLWLEEPHLTRARILLARNTPPDILEALQILDALYEITERTHNRRCRIEILALRALALEAQGKIRDSQDELRKAVRLSEVGGFIRVFVDLGLPMQEMLATLAQTGYSVNRIQRILAAFPDRQSTRSTEDGRTSLIGRWPHEYEPLAEPLTPREKQILALLREPISFKEIALNLGVRYATVKRHSINIYAKLGVNSRWDAVARAVELGILPR